jgi:hypothetical protein
MTGMEVGIGLRIAEWVARHLAWWTPKLEFVFDPSDPSCMRHYEALRDRRVRHMSSAPFRAPPLLFGCMLDTACV